MNKYCIICVYFGLLPSYYQAWLRSCKENPSIDFLLVTDSEVSNLPENVHVVRSSLQAFRGLAEEKLNMKISLEAPYKLCDYKPAFGLILEDYLQQYDFWGHCDMDMVFGDLSAFLLRYDQPQYDKFLPLGHLCIYRNGQDCLHRYSLKANINTPYQVVFSEPFNFAFDEIGINKIYNEYGFKKFDGRIFADIDKERTRIGFAVRENGDKDFPYELFYWQNGHAYCDYFINGERHTKEVIYIHFQKRKMPDNGIDFMNTKGFYIARQGFVEKNGESLLSDVERYNPYPGKMMENIDVTAKKIRKFFLMKKKHLKIRWYRLFH